MNISLPFHSETDENDGSGSDSSTQGTSTFILTPVVSSILSSKKHIVLSLILVGLTVGAVELFGMQPIVIISSVVVMYTLALTSFRFGPTGDLEPNVYEHSFLLIVSSLAIPVTVGVMYVNAQFTFDYLQQASRGLFMLMGWFINRQLYNSLKEDTMDLDIRATHSWLYFTRVPFTAVVALSLISTVSLTVWGGLTGYLVAVGFSYGMLRQITYKGDQVIIEMNETSEQTTDSTSDNLEKEVSITDDDTGEPTTAEDVVDKEEIETPDVQQNVDNFELAEEMTMDLKDSIDKVNNLLDDRDLSRQKLPTISSENIPPSTDMGNNLFKELDNLSNFLENYHPEDRELRMEVLETQQTLQEIDEYIYMEIGSDSEKYK